MFQLLLLHRFPRPINVVRNTNCNLLDSTRIYEWNRRFRSSNWFASIWQYLNIAFTFNRPRLVMFSVAFCVVPGIHKAVFRWNMTGRKSSLFLFYEKKKKRECVLSTPLVCFSGCASRCLRTTHLPVSSSFTISYVGWPNLVVIFTTCEWCCGVYVFNYEHQNRTRLLSACKRVLFFIISFSLSSWKSRK